MSDYYGYFKDMVLWFPNGINGGSINLTNYLQPSTTSENFDPTNNKASIKLLDNKLVYNNSEFLIKEDDPIIVYSKFVSNVDDKDINTGDVIWSGKFVDYKKDESPDGVLLTLSVMDWGYDIFNRYSPNPYLDESKRTNEVIIDIIKNVVENDDGSYKLDFSNVASVRNDSSSFPYISFGGNTKPIYESIQELVDTEWTNSESELISGQVIKYPMVFRIKGTSVYYYEQPLTQSMVINDSTFIQSISYSTQNEDSANYLILECGSDLNNEPITTYIYDELSGAPIIKESFKHEVKLAGEDTTYDNQYHQLRARSISEGWSNNEFIDEVRKLAKSYAKVWFRVFGRVQPNISIVLPNTNIDLGDLVYMDRSKYDKGLYRVVNIARAFGGSNRNITLKMEKFEG